jgi:hypothetical protein
MPAKNSVGRDNRRDLRESATTEPVSARRQPTAFVIREAQPATEMRAEDTVFFNRICDARLLLVSPAAGPRVRGLG